MMSFPAKLEKRSGLVGVFLLLLSALPHALTAQTYQWAKGIGGTDNDGGTILTDPAGNSVYATGFFSGTADFDPGPGVANLTATGFNDIFLARYDINGNYLWAFNLGSSMSTVSCYCSGVRLALDPAGNIFVAGEFCSTVDFDPGPGVTNLSSAGNLDIFMAKYDANGNYLWARSMGGTEIDEIRSLDVNSAGELIIGGYFTGTTDLDPGPGTAGYTSAGAIDNFFAKYDVNGNYLWGDVLAGPDYEMLWSLASDEDGNIYIAGQYSSAMDFDPGPSVATLSPGPGGNAFFAKYNSNGNYIWAKSISGFTAMSGASARCIKIDHSSGAEHIYLAGICDVFNGGVDFDPGPGIANITGGVSGTQNVFFAKYDTSGAYQFARLLYNGTTGGYTEVTDNALWTDAAGNLYVAGNFTEVVDFDPGTGAADLTSVGNGDIFFAKYNAQGDYQWAHDIGSTGDEYPNQISTASGDLYLAGNFSNTADFNPAAGIDALTSSGNLDFFIAKYALCTPASTQNPQHICNGGSYSINNHVYHLEGVYHDTLATQLGCDSIITTELNVDSLNTLVSQLNGVLTSDLSGASYQWLDCASGYVSIAGATSQSYTPAVNGNYAVALALNGCADTSACMSFTLDVAGVSNETQQFRIYPNPNNGSFFIDVPHSKGKFLLRIYNALGSLAGQMEIFQGQTRLTTKLTPGLYFMELSSDGKGTLCVKMQVR